MKNRVFSAVMAVISGLSAIAYIANCVKDFTVRTPGAVDGWNLALAVIWSAACVIQLVAWLGWRKKENESGKSESKP